ncbi:hypothetical protein EDB84DRAFT_1600375 [Lactarius hengduanensis]|nr:hypothetical protein EDB84DRAFT_1600375 [Lactarius hengduanensis]
MASSQNHIEVELDTGAALRGVPMIALMLVPPNVNKVVLRTLPGIDEDGVAVTSSRSSSRAIRARDGDRAVRIARALAPKSYIFGIFDLGPASRGQLPFRIRVLTASRLAIDHHIPLPSFHLPRTHTHTHSLSLLPLARPPLVAVDRRRHPKTLPSPSYAGRAFPRLMSSMSSSLSAAFGHPQDAVGARAPPLDSEEESYCHNVFRFPCIASPIRTVCLSRSSPRSASRLMPPPFPILLLLLPFLPG